MIRTDYNIDNPNYVALKDAVYQTDQEVVVSISSLVFNHVKFIEAAVEGFLMQRTNFKVEIVIHDDASTDGTTAILKKYEAKYPHLFKLFIQPFNTYKHPDRIELRSDFRKARTGKYIALCEGDDYWTDPFKLQKQVEYLESHPDCVLIGHDAAIINQKGEIVKSSKLPDQFKRDASSQELKRGFFVLTLSMVFRNVLNSDEYIQLSKKVLNGDTFLISMLGQYGCFHYMPEIQPAVYRIHEGGVWSLKSKIDKKYAQANTYFLLSNYYQSKEDEQTTLFYSQKAIKYMENWYYETIKSSRFLEKYYAFRKMSSCTEGKRWINFKALIKSFF